MKRLLYFFLLINFSIFLDGCYPGGPEVVSDQDIVITDHDPQFDFTSKKTYFLDSVIFDSNIIDPDITEEDLEAVEAEFEKQFNTRGFERVDENTDPDFYVGVTVIAVHRTGSGWVPGPWCPPGWPGCWYPWYPPGYWFSYSFTTGSVVANIMDPNDPIQNVTENREELKAVWNAVFNGLVSGSADNNAVRIQRGIEQAFVQSPYLTTK